MPGLPERSVRRPSTCEPATGRSAFLKGCFPPGLPFVRAGRLAITPAWHLLAGNRLGTGCFALDHRAPCL